MHGETISKVYRRASKNTDGNIRLYLNNQPMQGLSIPVTKQTLFINVPPLKTVKSGELSVVKISGTFYSSSKPTIRY